MTKDQKRKFMTMAKRDSKFSARFLANPRAAGREVGVTLTPKQIEAIRDVVKVIRKKGKFIPLDVQIKDIWVQNRSGRGPKKRRRKGGKGKKEGG